MVLQVCIDEETGEFVSCDTPGAVPVFAGTQIYQTGGGTVSSPNVNIQLSVAQLAQVGIVNQVNVAQQVLDEIKGSITDAITAGSEGAAQIAKQTEQDISQAVNQSVSAVVDSAKGLFGGVIDYIKQGLQSLATNIGNIVGKIADTIGPIIQKVADVVQGAFRDIASAIQQYSAAFQKILDEQIIPVINIVNKTLQTVSTLTTAIENDLKNGLAGILQIPADIANGLGSLSATIDRSISQMHNNNKELVDVNFKTAAEDSIGSHIKSLGSSITSITGKDLINTTFSANVKLPEPSLSQAGSITIDAMWKEIQGVVESLIHGGQPTLDGFKTALIPVLGLLAVTGEIPSYLVAIIGATLAGMVPFFSFIKNDLYSKTGLEKLPTATALEAWLRGFIDDPTLQAELGVNGWDAQRVQVLKDLETQLIDVATITDMYFREIVTVADWKANMKQHGFTDADQQAIIEQSSHIFDIATATRSYLYGRLTQEELQQILKVHRFTDNEIQVFIANQGRPEGLSDYMGRIQRGFIEGRYLTPDGHYSKIEDGQIPAALSEGLDSDIAADRWHAQFQIPALQHWVSLYFRGIRTKEELTAVMNYYRIPQPLQDDVIEVQRSLIPWRTIPTMLSKGIITEAYAKQQLQAHGFDLTATLALLNYATASKKAASANASGDIHAASVATARNLWDIGAFTDEQYTSVLEAHGYAPDQAALVLSSEKLALHAKERRQLAADLVVEVTTGLITLDQARQQMSANNFSQAEIAKVLNSINRAQRQASKTPGEAELRHMHSKGAITLQDYQQALSVLGYAQKWVTAFTETYFGSELGTTSTA